MWQTETRRGDLITRSGPLKTLHGESAAGFWREVGQRKLCKASQQRSLERKSGKQKRGVASRRPGLKQYVWAGGNAEGESAAGSWGKRGPVEAPQGDSVAGSST